MAILTTNATLDGVNNFSLFDDDYSWSGNYRTAVDSWGGDGPDTRVFNLTFAGDWTLQMLRISGDFAVTNITDLNDGGDRDIELLRLGGLGGIVTLGSISVDTFRARAGDGDVTLNLGSGGVDTIVLGDGNNRVNGGTGFIGTIASGNGDDTVVLQGGADLINLDSGNNSITTGAGYVGAINMYSNTPDANTIVVGSGGVRSIGLSNGRDSVTLVNNAFVEQMILGNNNDTLTLQGTAGINQADMGDGTNVVSVGAGSLNALTAYGGNDTVTLTTGHVQSMSLGAGNNVVNVGSGSIQTLLAYEGNDTVRLGAGGQIGTAALNDGNNKVTLANNARIDALLGYGGNDVVTLNGNARIYMIKLDGGNNVLTTADGNVESYYSFGGNNTLNIGAGGIQQVVLSGDGGTHVVNSVGFLGSLQVYGLSSSTVTVNDGAISIFTGKGADVINVAAANWVGNLATWEADDRVTVGAGSVVEHAHLDTGNDLIKLNTVRADDWSDLHGGLGTDTIDLSQLAVDTTFTLGLGWQALGAGWVSVVDFENLIGTAQADGLTGSAVANVLNGAVGNDMLSGLAGADLLIGGRGDDSLTGGADADTFQFSAGGGRDRIADFQAGVDLIEFTSATSLASITFSKQGTGVLLKVGTAEVVVENTTVAVMNDVDNFIF